MSGKRNKAQAFVEFAIIIPILLVVLTGIIEFGYAFYTWVAIGEVARIGTRYAVTGQYDPQYCPAAAAALTNATWPNLAADDLLDGAADCIVPSTPSTEDDFEAQTAALQDWARIPSTRDAAMDGGAIGLLFNPAVSGDYVQFLSHPAHVNGALPRNGFRDDYRGDPTANGYISVNICSNRDGVGLDTENEYHYQNQFSVNEAHFLGVCVANGYYIDDAGGPGDRIRVTITYNHPLIIPFFQAIWPHLKLSTTQDAIVEKFRTSRFSGLSGGISIAGTWTSTPLPTDTPTATPIPPTNTPTSTYTPTPEPCTVPPGGNGLLARFYAFYGDPYNNAFTNLVYTRIDPQVDFDFGGYSPVPGVVPDDDFRVQWSGQVYPPYPSNYRFITISDDGVRLFIDGNQVINNWTDHGWTWDISDPTYLSCGAHDIILQYFQGSGDSLMWLGWRNNLVGEMIPIPQQYLFSTPVPFEPTSTYVTPTPTSTLTPTPSFTPTRTLVPSLTFTPSQTFTPRPPTATFTPRPPTSTFTPTVYVPPTQTFTSSPIPTRTNTPTPSNTPPPTATFTPRPTCGIPPDAGGCTPIPP